MTASLLSNRIHRIQRGKHYVPRDGLRPSLFITRIDCYTLSSERVPRGTPTRAGSASVGRKRWKPRLLICAGSQKNTDRKALSLAWHPPPHPLQTMCCFGSSD